MLQEQPVLEFEGASATNLTAEAFKRTPEQP